MNVKHIFLFLPIILIILLSGCSEVRLASQKGDKNIIEELPNIKDVKEFSSEDLKVFEEIKSFYPDFNYLKSYSGTDDNGLKLVFPKVDDLYFGTYVSYESVYYPDDQMVRYSFDAGTSNRGSGVYIIIDENNVVKIEKSFGVSAYGYEIFKNGIKIDDDTFDIKN